MNEENVIFIAINEDQIQGQVPLHRALTGMNGVKDLWNFIPGAYVVFASITTTELAEQIRSRYPNLHYLVIKLDQVEFEGGLPASAWNNLWSKFANLKTFDAKIKP